MENNIQRKETWSRLNRAMDELISTSLPEIQAKLEEERDHLISIEDEEFSVE